ncbi:cell surface glycolipoprotein Mpt83 [Microbacterium sediminicola]|uniref:Cell surface glycolipoprotein Mpt83 n=1 Tax=Microbacterium sediminicola TaxID=415210 RepID=A0ABN2IJG1_9MICO
MFTTTRTFKVGATAIALASAFTLAACSSGSGSMTTDDMSSDDMSTPMETEEMDTMDPAAYLVGAGCADYAAAVPDGAGSVEGMSLDPVATAASNNPLLTTLVAAVSGGVNPDVDLVDTLNSGEYTVFAPVDDAFAKIDQATIDTLATDSDLLTSILTYHVISGQILPDDIDGTHTTLQGSDVEVTGMGDEIMVNGEAAVICGGVQTANATVYLIDTVLLPPM